MNKLYALLLLAVVCTGISSCKKEDKGPKPISIVGTWRTVSVYEEYFLKEKPIGVKVENPINGYIDHAIFNADLTGTLNVGGQPIRKFTYTATNSDIHYANVISYNGKDWVSTPSFMFYLNSLTDREMVFNDQQYAYSVQLPNIAGKEYNKKVTTYTLTKE